MRNTDPAFPIVTPPGNGAGDEYGSIHLGLTLRDYFAAATLRGSALLTVVQAEEIARDAYKVADAMLKERAK